jgi:multiple sugar transport system permease protein
MKTRKMRVRSAKKLKRFATYLVVLLVALVVLVPYAWMISGSFKETLELQSSDVTVPGLRPSWIPRGPTLRNYREVNLTVPMLRYFRHSIIISLGTMVAATLLALPAAYALSRFNFRGRGVYTISVLATQMLPGILFLIPYYLIFTTVSRHIGIPLRDTYGGMIFTYTSFALPFSIVMLRSYLNGIPLEIDEQAMIDGCTQLRALWTVIVPLATPGIAAEIAKEYDDIKFGEPFTMEYYGIAIRKNNTDLIKKINRALASVKASGEYDKIYANWFGAN